MAGLLGDILIGDGGSIHLTEFAEQVFHRGGSGFAVDVRDGGFDLGGVSHGQFDILLQDEAQLTDDGRVERVLRDQRQLASFVGDGQHDVLMGLRRLEQFGQGLARIGRHGGIKLDLKMVGDGL